MASSASKTSSTVTKIFRRRLFRGGGPARPSGGRSAAAAGSSGRRGGLSLSLGRLLSPRPQFRERLPLVRGRFPVLGGRGRPAGARGGSTGGSDGGLPGFWARDHPRAPPESAAAPPPSRRPSGPPAVLVIQPVPGVLPKSCPVILGHGILFLIDAGIDPPLGLAVGLFLACAGRERSSFSLCLISSSEKDRLFTAASSSGHPGSPGCSDGPTAPRSRSSSTVISSPKIIAWSKSSQTRRRSSSTPSKARLGSI